MFGKSLNSILLFSIFPILFFTISTKWIKTPHNTGVMLFVNRVNLGFEDIEDTEPTTTFELTNDDLKENADNLILPYVKYQRVKSITLFIDDNNGGEVTSLGGVKFFGKHVAATNMADLKKQGWGS